MQTGEKQQQTMRSKVSTPYLPDREHDLLFVGIPLL
jgi:hypothetical protein